jgi:phosphonoacetaldehyde hydrolase
MTIRWEGVRGVLLDWAGTTVDHGSCGPAQVFHEIFAARGITVTAAQARGPMGRAKDEHIRMLLELPEVAEQWIGLYGRPATGDDVLRLYEEFLPLQKQVLASHSAVIPGVVTAIDRLRLAGLAIGSTTGYTRELMAIVEPLAAAQGYKPDACVCADQVPQGRPAPWMNLQAAQQLGVFPVSAWVAVDDTPVGIQAAKHAGMLAVGVSRTGNALGLSLEELERLSPAELGRKLAEAERQFLEAGADAVIASVADLPTLLLAG